MKHVVRSRSGLGVLQLIGQQLRSAAFPQLCLLCATPGTMLCAACKIETQAQLRAACMQCGLPLHTTGICGACISQPPAFDATIAAALYAPPFDQLILGLKFHAQIAYAPLFADLLFERVEANAHARPAQGPELDRLIPVPLSRTHLADRGFNQALEIARPLGRRLHLPVDTDSLLRVVDTLPQASLPYEARHKNMRGAFALSQNPHPLHGLHVGVIDDVMTTGTTLNEFAKILKRAGVARVTNLVVARTP